MSTEQEQLTPDAMRKMGETILSDDGLDKYIDFLRNFMINEVRKFLGIEVSDEEVCAIFYKYISLSDELISFKLYFGCIYDNMLLERKVLNRHARHHEIRYEDSFAIIKDFISKICNYQENLCSLNDRVVKYQQLTKIIRSASTEKTIELVSKTTKKVIEEARRLYPTKDFIYQINEANNLFRSDPKKYL